MKDRILAYLHQFSQGEQNALAEELKQELDLDEATFQMRSQEMLSAILHGYAQFSISTIDAFFQRVIRSFTREAGLVGDYRLEIETDVVMEEVIDRLIAEMGTNDNLTRWLVDFANENLENDRAWDVRESLIAFSKEIFSEPFKQIEDDLHQVASQKDFFPNLIANLRKQRNEFVREINARAAKCVSVIESNNLVDADFKWSRGGVYSFLRKKAVITSAKGFEVKERAQTDFINAGDWPSKKSSRAAVVKKIAEELAPQVSDMIDYAVQHRTRALSAEVVLSNFYAFGLLFDISRKLHEYKEEHTLMLLSDAPKFLNALIGETDTPFIYEKVGSFYRNFLIDEFQDTSGMQWKNFLPLITNGLDQGLPSVVVGDVKQAIYRWRGGDLNLLQERLEKEIGAHRVTIDQLNTNYRSAPNLIQFNNEIFRTLASIAASFAGDPSLLKVYDDVAQQSPGGAGGYVRVRFIEESEEKKWEEEALDDLARSLESLQTAGVKLKDIAILVRRHYDGQRVVEHLVKHKKSERAKPDCRYDVVSNESLLLKGAASINLILAAMRYLANTDDVIARAQLAYEFARIHEPTRPLPEVFSVANQMDFENNLPPEFSREKLTLRKLPLFELTENMIRIFDLGNQQGEIAYLQAFQDTVLDFSGRERSDINSFLDWWKLNETKKSIQVSDEVDAAQIVTIHKAKGLQFKYVIIPFCSWNVDHDGARSPMLWVKSTDSLFTGAGFVPVKYSSTLKDTFFKSDYQQEKVKSALDNLNLLYVALTRAEKGMIILAPASKSNSSGESVSKWLMQAIGQLPFLFPPPPTPLEWVLGTVDANTKDEERSVPAVTLQQYRSVAWRNKLVIRQAGKNFFTETSAEQEQALKKRNYGVHLHYVLSRIQYKPDLPRVIEELKSEGWITHDELPDLERDLIALFENPLVASWFQPDWVVRTEVPVLLPDGGEYRIDRLLTRGDHAIVIDFKTGQAQREDQEQVKAYLDALSKMQYRTVEGHLLYMKTHDVVSVPPGRKISSKKKNENQLGIDF